MAFEIEWLESAQNELDAEIAFVLNEFGFKVLRTSRTDSLIWNKQ